MKKVYDIALLRELTVYIKSSFTLPSGILSARRDNGLLSDEPIWSDFGDVAAFFIRSGEMSVVESHISKISDYFQNGLLVSAHPTFGIHGLVKSYEYTDFILGLQDYHAEKSDADSRDLLLYHIDQCIKIFGYDRKIGSYYHTKFKIRLPVIDTRDGMMIEIFCDLAETLNNKKYLDIAENIRQQILRADFFKEHGILPDFITHSKLVRKLLATKFEQGEITKNNINTLYGLLRLWRSTQRAEILSDIDQIVDSIISKASTDEGGIVKTFQPGIAMSTSFLTASFGMIDFLCDLSYFTGTRSYLDQAKRIADFWLLQQSSLGLFPWYSGKSADFFDSETDMCVALFKLHELTGDDWYFEAANKCYSAIIKFHGAAGYSTQVDIHSAKVLNNTQKTKFIALFIKLVILKHELDNGGKIYLDTELYNFLRDR